MYVSDFGPSLLPDTFFYLGTDGSVPEDAEIQGFPIPDEMGSDQPLGAYVNKTLLLAIPPADPDIFSCKWLSVWSTAMGISLAHVPIPVEPNVPPALEKLGVDPQVSSMYQSPLR